MVWRDNRYRLGDAAAATTANRNAKFSKGLESADTAQGIATMLPPRLSSLLTRLDLR